MLRDECVCVCESNVILHHINARGVRCERCCREEGWFFTAEHITYIYNNPYRLKGVCVCVYDGQLIREIVLFVTSGGSENA